MLTTTSKTTVIDPVCGMQVDPEKAAGKREYNGKTFHFCSESCLHKFETNPAEYAGKSEIVSEHR